MKLIFDLDGTLIDSAIVVADIFNVMRAQRGLDSLGIHFYRLWSSRGGAMPIGDALEIDPAQAQDIVTVFRHRYHERKTRVESLFSTHHTGDAGDFCGRGPHNGNMQQHAR